MADLQITQLPELSSANLQATDPIAVADVSATETKKITIQCAACNSAGEVEDEDFSYDYSGFNVDKLQ